MHGALIQVACITVAIRYRTRWLFGVLLAPSERYALFDHGQADRLCGRVICKKVPHCYTHTQRPVSLTDSRTGRRTGRPRSSRSPCAATSVHVRKKWLGCEKYAEKFQSKVSKRDRKLYVKHSISLTTEVRLDFIYIIYNNKKY